MDTPAEAYRRRVRVHLAAMRERYQTPAQRIEVGPVSYCTPCTSQRATYYHDDLVIGRVLCCASCHAEIAAHLQP